MSERSGRPGQGQASAVLDDDSSRIRLFDFTRQETIERGRLRILRPVLESVAQRMSSTLASVVRQIVRIELPEELSQLSWEEYAPGLPDPTFICTTVVVPLERRFVMHLPVQLALLVIDFSLGGDGLGQPEREELTEIERSLLRPIAADLWRESILPALSSFLDLQPGNQQLSNSPIFVQVGRPGEICLIVEMRISVGDSENFTLSLAMPVSAMNAVIDSLERAHSGESLDPNESATAQVEAGLALVPVDLKVSYPSVRFTPAELVDLAPGDVLPLNPRTDSGPDLLEVLVGDALFAHGVLVDDGRNLAISITALQERTR